MAFSRSEVRRILGDAHTDEIENQLIALHIGVDDARKDEIDRLKAERDKYKAEADKLPDIQKELDTLKSGEDFKGKYESEHQAFEDFKKQVAREEELTKIKTAYRKLLADEHINEKRLDAVMKLTDFSEMKLDKDGNLDKVDDLKKAIDKEWGEYRVKNVTRKQDVATPPEGTGAGGSRAREIYLNHLKQQGVKVEDTGKE